MAYKLKGTLKKKRGEEMIIGESRIFTLTLITQIFYLINTWSMSPAYFRIQLRKVLGMKLFISLLEDWCFEEYSLSSLTANKSEKIT